LYASFLVYLIFSMKWPCPTSRLLVSFKLRVLNVLYRFNSDIYRFSKSYKIYEFYWSDIPHEWLSSALRSYAQFVGEQSYFSFLPTFPLGLFMKVCCRLPHDALTQSHWSLFSWWIWLQPMMSSFLIKVIPAQSALLFSSLFSFYSTICALHPLILSSEGKSHLTTAFSQGSEDCFFLFRFYF
jgi:hypothetical protein